MLVVVSRWFRLESSESRVAGCPAGRRRRQDGRHGEHREDRDGLANFYGPGAVAGHRRLQLYGEREPQRRGDNETDAERGSLGSSILGDGSTYARYSDDGTRTLLRRLSFLSGS